MLEFPKNRPNKLEPFIKTKLEDDEFSFTKCRRSFFYFSKTPSVFQKIEIMTKKVLSNFVSMKNFTRVRNSEKKNKIKKRAKHAGRLNSRQGYDLNLMIQETCDNQAFHWFSIYLFIFFSSKIMKSMSFRMTKKKQDKNEWIFHSILVTREKTLNDFFS